MYSSKTGKFEGTEIKKLLFKLTRTCSIVIEVLYAVCGRVLNVEDSRDIVVEVGKVWSNSATGASLACRFALSMLVQDCNSSPCTETQAATKRREQTTSSFMIRLKARETVVLAKCSKLTFMHAL